MNSPIRITLDNFRLRNRFPMLTDEQLTNAIQLVNTQFYGVYEMWGSMPKDIQQSKRELCISYLVGWQLVTMYPNSCPNVSGMGAMPIKSKRAGPVAISYQDTVRQSNSILSMLTTNEFGIQALLMIQSAPETYLIER